MEKIYKNLSRLAAKYTVDILAQVFTRVLPMYILESRLLVPRMHTQPPAHAQHSARSHAGCWILIRPPRRASRGGARQAGSRPCAVLAAGMPFTVATWGNESRPYAQTSAAELVALGEARRGAGHEPAV